MLSSYSLHIVDLVTFYTDYFNECCQIPNTNDDTKMSYNIHRMRTPFEITEHPTNARRYIFEDAILFGNYKFIEYLFTNFDFSVEEFESIYLRPDIYPTSMCFGICFSGKKMLEVLIKIGFDSTKGLITPAINLDELINSSNQQFNSSNYDINELDALISQVNNGNELDALISQINNGNELDALISQVNNGNFL